MRVAWALVGIVVGGVAVSSAHAQRALVATQMRAPQALPAPLLTLRPQPQLLRLAEEVAAVLELRTGQRVEVGSPPPPGLLEAVPTGHIAMATSPKSGAVLLVLGAPGGRSLEATVRLTAVSGNASDARAIALATESLRDAAVDTSRTPEPIELAADPEVEEPSAALVPAAEAPAPVLAPQAPAPHAAQVARDEGGARAGRGLFGGDVDPLVYARVYGGASGASSGPMAGFGAGLGLCVQRNCFFLAAEIPATTGASVAEHLDVRYRYTTFVSGFYARPFSFGPFTPGASLGFLTRLGHFRADMGYSDTGLDTDLGARGSVELAWEMVRGLDLMGEGGVDVTLDRQQLGTSEKVRNRGDRWSPWAQLALRYRL